MRLRIPPPILMLVAAGFMWVLDHWMPLARWIAPPWNRVIDVAALVRFRKAGTTVNPLDPSKASYLVTEGVFRVSRNPMYLGLVLLLIGWAIWLGSVSSLVVPPLFVIVITVVQIIPEEQALHERFDQEYAPYQRRGARWIG
ncbi:MAG: isoprenylcysteine carboxylmethyltransferase family protein [Betaproteobacteria bacterium]|nr:MAG: isoprenylcysteine carboxylmethyltransferase family protein [Betaproteobacteria bacterium]